jgi:hypothetical protein
VVSSDTIWIGAWSVAEILTAVVAPRGDPGFRVSVLVVADGVPLRAGGALAAPWPGDGADPKID